MLLPLSLHELTYTPPISFFPVCNVFSTSYRIYEFVLFLRPNSWHTPPISFFPPCNAFSNLYRIYESVLFLRPDCFIDLKLSLRRKICFGFPIWIPLLFKTLWNCKQFPMQVIYNFLLFCFLGSLYCFYHFCFNFCEFKMFLPLSTVFST